jgi:hypothetical protein
MEFANHILIAGDPADTAGVMFDPARETQWMKAVTSSVPQTAGIQPGAEVKRTSAVDGADVPWTTVVERFHFPHILRLTIGGGASGYIRYEVQRSGGGTVATVRASCERDLFGFDLEALKALVEGQ